MSVGAKSAGKNLDTLKNTKGEYFFQVGANANDMITLAISEGFHMSGIATMAGIKFDRNQLVYLKIMATHAGLSVQQA